MKTIFKIFLVLLLGAQNAGAYNSKKGAPSSPPTHPKTSAPSGATICTHCINADAVVGQRYIINGVTWQLDKLLPNGMWSGTAIYDSQSIKDRYDGRSADETFGRDLFSPPNVSRVRWMNAGYDLIDQKIKDATNHDFVSKLKTKIYDNTTKEAMDVVNEAKKNRIDSTEYKNDFVCPDYQCTETLSRFSALSFQDTNSRPENADDFIADFFRDLDNESPFIADQVGVGGLYSDQKPYFSERKVELNDLRDRLFKHRAKSPQQWDAKAEAFRQLRYADDSYLAMAKEKADAHFQVAETLVDIATDVIPFTSIPKDIYRAFVGKDPLTGKELSPFERALAASFATINTITAGAAGTIAAGIKVVGKAAPATAKEVALAEKLAEILAKSPLKVDVLVKGTTQEFTIIGRDMSRVNEVAAALDKHGIRVNKLNSFSIEARDQWGDLLLKFSGEPGGRIPPDAVKDSLMFLENQQWIRDALEKGHTILDLGDPLKREISAFYEMEKTEIIEFLKRMAK